MKKLKKLTLNRISDVRLDERKMHHILGGGYGDPCQCGCNYAGEPGGSSTSSNNSANTASGLNSGACPPPPEPEHPFSCDYERPLPPQMSICANQPGCWA